ncbi:MAG: BMP family ABC transporter substrate-binding protein [Lachnospiraceae bacterium]|nr:BMP family ABC transporter substrate-binding protein [Lachnospiraceae bacterium]
MRKLFALALSAMLAASTLGGMTVSADSADVDFSNMKVGFIFLHDENSTYDLNFMNSAKAAAANLGLSEDQIVMKVNIAEGEQCYETAADLADSGCNIIFADSFGHEDFMIEAAQEFPEVQFCHSTGTRAHTEGLDNYHNAFASIYEGRYLAGVAAGKKLNAMIEEGKITEDQALIGYVGAFTYAEVISGYTSFFLGARSQCPSATMKVTFTGSWYDETAEKEAANKLIQDGCVLISQHADSMGAPTACEAAGVPDVSYNGSTISVGPNSYIISSRIDWTPYYEHAITCAAKGEAIEADWTGTLATESVLLTELNDAVAADGTQDAIDAAKAALEDGSLHVFDVSTFTVTVTDSSNVNATVDENGNLTSYMADVDTDAAYEGDTEVVSDGYFHESEYRSAPYFDLQIDGIELLDTSF